MKVLFASASSGSRGGGELYQLYLGRALVDRGHEVSLWMSKHPRMDELDRLFSPIGRVIRSDYKNTYDLRGRSLAHLLGRSVVRRVAAEWRELAPNVIHVNKQNLEDGLDLLAAADHSRLPSLATIHITQSACFLGAKLAFLRDWMARRSLQRYRGMLVPVMAQREKELCQYVSDRDRIRLIVNGVPIFDLNARAEKRTAKRSQLGVPKDDVLVVGVGRMVAQKRPLHWLDWAGKIRAASPNTRFLWIGDGPLDAEFDARSTSLNLGTSVRRLPWTNEVPAFLFAADLFMHTAEFEGLPLALLEACSAGLPVAVTENLGTEMPFLNASNSLILNEDTPWAQVLCDRDHLAERGRAARRLAEQRFSFARMAQDYDQLYHEAIQKTHDTALLRTASRTKNGGA